MKELALLALLLGGTGLATDPREVASEGDDQQDQQQPGEELADRPRGRVTDPERFGAPRDTLSDVVDATFEESLGKAGSFRLHWVLSELPAQLVAEVLGSGTGRTVEPQPEGLPRPVEGEVELVLHERTEDSPRIRHLPRAEEHSPAENPKKEVDRVREEHTEDQTEEEGFGSPLVHLLGELPDGRDFFDRPSHQVVQKSRHEDDPEAVLQGHRIPQRDGHVEGGPEADELAEVPDEGFRFAPDDSPEQVGEGEANEAGEREGNGPGGGDTLQVAIDELDHGGSSE